jgi:hypothetical protein
MYRSTYSAVKGVIDGDLCERFVLLDAALKERIAGEVDRALREVERKISVSIPQSFRLHLLTLDRICELELLSSSRVACTFTVPITYLIHPMQSSSHQSFMCSLNFISKICLTVGKG